ncbi:protein [Escherichia coli]|nr:protein [Escherichia coli]
MIRLSEQSPLGTGRHRKCYAHPEDAQRCIKIVYHRGDGGDKEIRRELKYYAHLGRRLKDWSGILNRPGFPGEYFICELRLPDHRFRWKHNKLFLLLPEEYGPAFPAIVDCYTSPPT